MAFTAFGGADVFEQLSTATSFPADLLRNAKLYLRRKGTLVNREVQVSFVNAFKIDYDQRGLKSMSHVIIARMQDETEVDCSKFFDVKTKKADLSLVGHLLSQGRLHPLQGQHR